ncbi:hypothetical protein COUCH_15115 [Couchioplanes caeruleus]|uniref:hypothetical protein n=1 Tax=Couchioplanes caeruleus TaxID=56438 RepID=UPI0020C17ADD|nr:hypothetical protein [Couchioplanes caeruleus]UQU67515.1 hypothetical protein COUCH_15115 [Couchioplanes caeruleus]
MQQQALAVIAFNESLRLDQGVHRSAALCRDRGPVTFGGNIKNRTAFYVSPTTAGNSKPSSE